MRSKHLTNAELEKISAFDYDSLAEISTAWSEILAEHLAEVRGRRVLDAGCGAGFLSILLARAGWEVTALDYSAPILERARANALRYGYEDKITFCECDTTKTPLEAGSFDAIVSRHASAQFLQPFSVYEEWHRLLRTGGVLLNYDANWLSPLWDDEHAEAFLADEAKIRQEIQDYADIYHDRFALSKLSQFPLSYEKRPQWDEAACSIIGYSSVEGKFLPDKGIRTPVMSQRFRIIPTFVVKAVK